MALEWIILSGEYPPQTGGVSDYTRLVAHALVNIGDAVQIWAPFVTDEPSTQTHTGVIVHRLPDHFGLRGLYALKKALAKQSPDARLLVQYVPHAFGWKAMNVPFCLWLWARRKRHAITVMFHEVATPWAKRGQPWRLQFLALVTRLMAFLVARSAKRLCVSIPAWGEMLRPLRRRQSVEWLPVPSTMPSQANAARVARLRERLRGTAGQHLVGHFGTFGGHIAQALRAIAPRLLDMESRASLILIGRHSVDFAEELRRINPILTSRIIGIGELTADAVAEHLAACDLLIQPYPDGVSSRRTSVMASLALGLPVVTTRGPLTEPVWEQSGAVRLTDSAEELAAQAAALLADAPERARLSAAAHALYRERFCLEKIIAQLRSSVVFAA